VFQCLRSDDVVIPSGRHSVFDKNYGFCLKTQLWEDGCYRPDDVLYKARTCIPSSTVRTSAFMVRMIKLHIWKLRAPVQPSGRQPSWSGRSSFIYKNCVHQFNRPDVSLQGPDAPSLIMVISCSRSVTVRTLGQHCPDAALLWKLSALSWRSRCS
jgi:hypothetical protein